MATGCRKGSRECAYPEKLAAKPSSSTAARTSTSELAHDGDSSDDSESQHAPHRLEAIADEDEDGDEAITSALSTHSSRHFFGSSQIPSPGSDSEAPSLDKGSSPTPSTEGSTIYSNMWTDNSASDGAAGSQLRRDWSHLPKDLQFYLSYYQNNITCLHYSLKTNKDQFFKEVLIDAALRNDALLNALVGFSAYQYLLQKGTGRLQEFLQYYNKAVSLLLKSFMAGERHSMGLLMTILQLATIEVGIFHLRRSSPD